MFKRAAKSPLSWTSNMLWVSLRYRPTSTRGLNRMLLLSTSRCHTSLHLWSPFAEAGSGVSSCPRLFLVSSSSTQSSNDAQSRSDITSFSSAKENICAAPCPLVPLSGWTEQDTGRKAKRASRNWSICNWLQRNNRATFYLL